MWQDSTLQLVASLENGNLLCLNFATFPLTETTTFFFIEIVMEIKKLLMLKGV